MTLIVVGCVRSSPGTTTTALALAACIEHSVLIEGDPDGGVLVARCGLAPEPNLGSLAAGGRGPTGGDSLSRYAQPHPGGVAVVVGMASQQRMVNLWQRGGATLAAVLTEQPGRVVIVDAGRLTPASPLLGLLGLAAMTILVTRPRAEELVVLGERLGALRGASRRLGVVCVGDKPYSSNEVAAGLHVDVVGVIEDDARTAMALCGVSGTNRSSLTRTGLARSAREVAAGLLARLDLGPPGAVATSRTREVVR